MDTKKLSKILVVLGSIVLIAAFIWWLIFYSEIVRGLGGGKGWSDAFVCLFSFSGECAFISNLAKFGGAAPYEPLVFWVGIILLGIGLFFKFTHKSDKT